jgi:pyrroline-5-carboxylate reductase
MVDAGILLGLPRDAGPTSSCRPALGSAVMLRDSRASTRCSLREAVTSPCGTTIAASGRLERHSVARGADRGH